MKKWKDKQMHDNSEFRNYVMLMADEIGVSPTRIQLKPMKTKWASCSTAGRLTFSSELLNEKKNFRNYVVVHELLHLQIPNHGKLFKALLKAYLPNDEDFKRYLKDKKKINKKTRDYFKKLMEERK